MSPYALTLFSLALAVVVQSLAACLATWQALRPPYRRRALLLAVGFTLLALHDALSLELALHTGIFDLRQSLVCAGASLFLLFGVRRPRRSETLPPR